MKNIHILPTNKPSRLAKIGISNKLQLFDNEISFKTFEKSPQNIYITNDEEIKEGYYLDLTHNIIMKSVFYSSSDKNCKKIILTTDPCLIKDGVQAIENEFLEWFVKNPSCKKVDVKYKYWKEINGIGKYTYKIIIPKELNNLKNNKMKTAVDCLMEKINKPCLSKFNIK